MVPDDSPAQVVEVGSAAAHILALLDDVQERLAAIRKAAERIAAQQEESDAAQP